MDINEYIKTLSEERGKPIEEVEKWAIVKVVRQWLGGEASNDNRAEENVS